MKPGGTAFVVNDKKGSSGSEDEDIYIADGNLGNALHNDLVKVVVFPSRKGKRPEGQVVEIVERSQKQIVGVLHINKGIAYFIADNPSFRRDVLIPGRSLKGAHNGDKVVIRIVEWEAGTRSPLGEVIHVLGKPGDNEVEMQAILADNDFPLGFPETVEQEAAQIDSRISEQEIQRRRDFRRTLTFTIDPADAKDYDDAISYEKLDNGLHRVGIHIADVSFYVRPDTEIDHEAYLRGTSVYLVDRTIPMLPEVLSNNLCSLRPHEDKLCFSAVFDLDDNAKVHKEWFGHTVINSDRRFNYDEVQEIIEQKQGEMCDTILQLHQLAQILRKKRFDNKAINFETEEVKFKLDENSKPIGVYLKRTARQLPRTFVFRVHDEPLSDKLETFKNFVKKLGYDLKTTSHKAFTSSMNRMFEQVKGSNEYNMLSKLSIRIMARAAYSTDNIGHYGLAFPYYTHFTSPIRRYPDLMVHRLLDQYLAGKPSVNKAQYEEYCQHCSQMEQKASDAERKSVKFKQAEYLVNKIGQVFDATVSGISKWGVYAELDESKCEGMIPMRTFDDDFYYIDEDNYTLVGLHHGHDIRFGDNIKVRVVEVDLLRKQMTFERVDS